MAEKVNDYEDDIQIDEDFLDVEWLEQPRLFLQYSRRASEARDEMERAKQLMDLTKAEVDLDVRKNPGNHKLEKVTEGAISAAILMDSRFQEALNEARHNYNVLMGAVSAFEQRKTALENLVKLHGQNYFAGPKVPHDLGQVREMKKQRANEKVNVKRKRKE